MIVATAYHLPSSCFIDWQHLAILIEEEDANRTGEIVKKYLEDPAKLEKMRKNLLRVRLLGPDDDDDLGLEPPPLRAKKLQLGAEVRVKGLRLLSRTLLNRMIRFHMKGKKVLVFGGQWGPGWLWQHERVI